MINSKISLIILSAILVLSFILVGLPTVTVQASNGDTQFQIDVWTDKGGRGEKNPGGTYYVGEEITLFIETNMDCKANLMIYVVPNKDYFNGTKALKTGIITIPLGQAKASDIGIYLGATFQATSFYEGSRIDSTTWNVIPAPIPTPTPIPMPTPQPQPSSSPELPTAKSPGTDEPVDTLDAENATELLALSALKMAEGKLPADPKMDVDKDGKVTQKDAAVILKWAVKGADSETSKPAQQSESPDKPEIQISPPAQDDDRAIVPESTEADTQTLEGKWEMTRQSIQPQMPDLVPDFLVNQIIPQKITLAIKSVNDDLTVKHDGRDTWYKTYLLGNGLTEDSTVAIVDSQGLSCLFKTPVKFYWESLPFPFGFIVSNIKEIKGSFTDSVNVSVSGNNISATITFDNMQGTYLEKDKNGNSVNKQIHFNGKVVYKGTKK